MYDTIAAFFDGLLVASLPLNLAFCFFGALLGTLIGVLPGIGPVTTVAILMPVTFHLPPVTGLIMLAGIYYGAQYGGSTTAILVNLPGENSSIVTCIEGHQLARRGRAGPALSIAALSSLLAGCLTTLFIAACAPLVVGVALLFGPAEYFSLMLVGLVATMVLAHGSLLKALGMVAIGLLLSMVGTDLNTGVIRMTLGFPELREGIDFVPLAMGIFAVGEIIRNLERPERRGSIDGPLGRLWPSREDFRRGTPAALRGTALGAFLGLLPGGGATLSSFAAYALERRLTRHPEEFGHGAVEGLAAPEAANNAGAQASFIPLLTMGVPSNVMIALLAGVMMIHGVQPGPQVMVRNPELFWGLIASMLVGNIMLVVINLPLVGIWVRLLQIPYRALYLILLVFCSIGVYSVDQSIFDVWALFVLGAFGYILNKLDFEPAPLVIAFVLGPLMEEYFRRALLVSRGDYTVFVARPISLILLAIAVLLAAMVIVPAVRNVRKVAFSEET